MFNLIKMELYRLFKSSSTWILIFVTVLVTLFVVSITKVDIDLIAEQQESIRSDSAVGIEIEDDETVTVHTGFFFDTSLDWINNDVNIAEFVNVTLRSCILLIMLAIFAATYVNAENKSGFVKNIAGQIRWKGSLFLAKMPALLVFTVIEFLTMYIISAVSVRLIIGRADLSLSADMVKALLTQLLLHFAFVCAVAFLAVLSRGTVLPSTIGIVSGAGIMNLLWAAVDILVKKLGIADNFTVTKYALVNNIQLIGTSSELYSMSRAVLIGFIFIFISAAASFAVMNKRDIR